MPPSVHRIIPAMDQFLFFKLIDPAKCGCWGNRGGMAKAGYRHAQLSKRRGIELQQYIPGRIGKNLGTEKPVPVAAELQQGTNILFADLLVRRPHDRRALHLIDNPQGSPKLVPKDVGLARDRFIAANRRLNNFSKFHDAPHIGSPAGSMPVHLSFTKGR